MKRSTSPLACIGAATLLVAPAACGANDGAGDSAAADSVGAAGSAAQTTPAAGDSAGATGGMIDPNTATSAQLSAIPGIDSATAAAVVAGRPYADMTGVDKVLAAKLSEAQRDTVYTRLWKPIDLNSASDAEILLIPGIGDKMLHEFKEYRPYTNIAQFRREMGKYVDDAEVARMERYVTIRQP
jgi:DNA uptake protein ComE-like DNA-binding protein